jgi:hypothetical protein
LLHQRDRLAQARDLRALHRARRVAASSLSISWRARMVSSGASRRDARGGRGLDVAHVDARAHAHLDEALDSSAISASRTDGPRHPELHGEVSLGRQSAGDGNPALDQRAQLVGDLPVQAPRRDGLQGMGGAGRRQRVKWSDQLQERYARTACVNRHRRVRPLRGS